MSNSNPDNSEAGFHSIHTSNLPIILKNNGISLLVTTYQSGRAILVRADGDKLNTHFELYNKPMGVAVHNNQLYMGIKNEIVEFRNTRELANRVEPKGKHDACFVPRRRHTTGSIDIHEMVCDKDDKLWYVNTLFSCICSLDSNYSFVPEWRPNFISGYAPEDRCHLNGICCRDGYPRYVTALGSSNDDKGWRKNKRDGGIIMDIKENRIIAKGLSMPHSPRWYRETLWVLESGYGHLSKIDPETGVKTNIAQVPGFTRGISFVGDLAFIGLSQVRETATFNNLPLLERDEERSCGVWVVNINTGETVAFLKFEGQVQEIFAVEVLPDSFPIMLNDDDSLIDNSYVLPNEALAELEVPQRADKNPQ